MSAIAHPSGEFTRLREAFKETLPGRLDEVQACWEQTAGREQAIRTLAHQLGGAAATFGLPELAAPLAQLEQLCTEGAPALAQEAFQALLDGLRQAADRVRVWQPPQPGAVQEAVTTALYLLESDPFTARGMSDQLGSFGYEVRPFRTVTALLDALKLERPAALLLDADIAPGIPADLSLLQQYQAARPQPLPVVVLSERPDLEARLQAVRAGGQAFLSKPVDVLLLTELLEDLIPLQPEAFKVLVVEDDPLQAEEHARILRQAGMQPTLVTDPLLAMKPLEEGIPDLVLMDVFMPGCSGVELAAIIRQQESHLGVPIVFASRAAERELQLEALRMGGDDFLIKPVDPAHLVAVVTARARRGRTLRSRLSKDGLTGVLNHATLMDQLSLEACRVQRGDTPLSFALLDLDHFRQVNEAHGHAAGDRVIRSLARMLQQRLRRTDLVGRHAGEQFAVILPGADGEAAQGIVDRIREGFGKVLFPFGPEGQKVTLSCGVASWSTCLDAQGLAATAERALQEAKRRGRNRTVLAN